MATSSEKKRKRNGETNSKPSKKVAIEGPVGSATVASVLQPKSSPPVVALTPGIEIDQGIHFSPYVSSGVGAPRKLNTRKRTDRPELLLHSAAHQTLDYTAREEGSRASAPLLNHFVGVFDPKTGKLQVVEARKMVVRGQVRAKQPADADPDDAARKTNWDRRTDLGQAFGTKKARKALNDRVINAIVAEKDSNGTAELNSAGKAMLNSVGAIASTMASREELQASVDEAKPVPFANILADEIQDVYKPEELIGSEILKMMPVLEWQEKAKHGENIGVPSRFAASRITAIALNSEASVRLRVLRYFVFVLLFYLKTKPGKQKGTRRVLPREKLMEELHPAPQAVVESIRRKFSDGGEMRKFHIDLLMTHMCAFACLIDNFLVDTSDLMFDLRLTQKDVNAYFHEIGARVKPAASKEPKGPKRHVARLALPLSFPKQRFINPTKR